MLLLNLKLESHQIIVFRWWKIHWTLLMWHLAHFKCALGYSFNISILATFTSNFVRKSSLLLKMSYFKRYLHKIFNNFPDTKVWRRVWGSHLSNKVLTPHQANTNFQGLKTPPLNLWTLYKNLIISINTSDTCWTSVSNNKSKELL